MKYKVTYEYRGKITVEVEAADEKAAEKAGLAEADEVVLHNLSLYDINAREVKA